MGRIPRGSQILLAMAVFLSIAGVAGSVVGSFAYLLALLLAVLFGAVGAASVVVARSPRQRGWLFALVIVVALAAMYVYLVSGGGGPPPPTRTR